MIRIGNAILSDEIAEKHFVCDLIKCKGACCVEGDLGAPLAISELKELEESKAGFLPFLSEEGRIEIERQGLAVETDPEDWSTPTINGRECAYAIYENDILFCGIEKAWKAGKSTFRKPISCHLYPIRITQYEQFEALNYERWDICSPACAHGDALKVPIYKFLKEALTRKYGEAWYKELVAVIEKA